jgi:hypothetical protein
MSAQALLLISDKLGSVRLCNCRSTSFEAVGDLAQQPNYEEVKFWLKQQAVNMIYIFKFNILTEISTLSHDLAIGLS